MRVTIESLRRGDKATYEVVQINDMHTYYELVVHENRKIRVCKALWRMIIDG